VETLIKEKKEKDNVLIDLELMNIKLSKKKLVEEKKEY
jgi:hypothetical protein